MASTTLKVKVLTAFGFLVAMLGAVYAPQFAKHVLPLTLCVFLAVVILNAEQILRGVLSYLHGCLKASATQATKTLPNGRWCSSVDYDNYYIPSLPASPGRREMIRIDFDVPSYLRLPQGLWIVSEPLAHKLPGPESNETLNQALEPVVINTLYRPQGRNQVASIENQEQGETKGEFIPRESQPAHQETAQEIQVAQGDEDQDERAPELNFQSVAGRSVTGEYRGSGFAHYRFLKKNGKSFFLRIGEHLVWGIELNAQLRQSGAQQGDKISLTFLGKTAVSVLKEVVVDGKKEQEWVDTYRNSWEIKIVK